MFLGTMQLVDVSYEVHEGKMVPPGLKQEEAIDVIVLAFVCSHTQARVEIPMPTEYAHKLAAALDGRQIIVAKPGAGGRFVI